MKTLKGKVSIYEGNGWKEIFIGESNLTYIIDGYLKFFEVESLNLYLRTNQKWHLKDGIVKIVYRRSPLVNFDSELMIGDFDLLAFMERIEGTELTICI